MTDAKARDAFSVVDHLKSAQEEIMAALDILDYPQNEDSRDVRAVRRVYHAILEAVTISAAAKSHRRTTN